MKKILLISLILLSNFLYSAIINWNTSVDISQNVIISLGDTLVIEPGTIINYSGSSYTLTILGRLECNGTALNKISSGVLE